MRKTGLTIQDRVNAVKTYNTPVKMSLDGNLSAQCKTLAFNLAKVAVESVGGVFKSERTADKLYNYYVNNTALDKNTAALKDYFDTGKVSSAADLRSGDIWITGSHAAEILYGLREVSTKDGKKYVLEKDMSKATHFAVRESVGRLGYEVTDYTKLDDRKRYYQYNDKFYELSYSGSRTQTRLADRNKDNIVIGKNGELTLHNVINVFPVGYINEGPGVFARFKNVDFHDYDMVSPELYSDALAEAYYNEFDEFYNGAEAASFYTGSAVKTYLNSKNNMGTVKKHMAEYDTGLRNRGELKSDSLIGAPIPVLPTREDMIKRQGGFGGAGASRSFAVNKSRIHTILIGVKRLR